MPATQLPTCRATEWPTAFRTKSVRACQTSTPCSEVTRKLVALECRNDRQFPELLILTGLRSRNAPRRTLRLNLQPTGKRCGETKHMMGGLGRCRAGPGRAGAGGGRPLRGQLEQSEPRPRNIHSHRGLAALARVNASGLEAPRPTEGHQGRPPAHQHVGPPVRPASPSFGRGPSGRQGLHDGRSDSRHVERPDKVRPRGRAGGVPETFAERAP